MYGKKMKLPSGVACDWEDHLFERLQALREREGESEREREIWIEIEREREREREREI